MIFRGGGGLSFIKLLLNISANIFHKDDLQIMQNVMMYLLYYLDFLYCIHVELNI